MTNSASLSAERRRGRLLFKPGEAFEQDILRPLLSPEAYEHRRQLVLGSAAIAAAAGVTLETPTRQAFGSRLPNSWRTNGTRIGVRSATNDYDKRLADNQLEGFIYERIFYYFRLVPSHARSLTGLLAPADRALSRTERHGRELAATALGFAVHNHELPDHVRHLHDVDEQVRHINALLADKEATVPSYYYVDSRPNIVELY
jgi:hypothetical protein